MTLSLNKLPWYGQIGVFAAVVVAAAATFWNFRARDAQEAIDAKRAQLAQVRAGIDRGLAITRRLPQFRKEVADLEMQLERLRAVLPEEQDVADLLRRVQGMATESNLTIRGFAPQTPAKKTLHMEWPINLKLEGRYHDLGSFLERVSKFPRIINVNALRIRSIENGAGGATMAADATATTFVLSEGTPDPKAAAPGAATAPAAAPAARAAVTSE